MPQDRDADFLCYLATEVALIVVAHLDDTAIVRRWLSVVLDPDRCELVPGFNQAAFFDVLGGAILRRAPNDERARTLVGELSTSFIGR